MQWIERVLICGDREWTNRRVFDAAMDAWIAKHGMPTTVIEGCARGADRMAEEWANAHGIDFDGFGDLGDIGPIEAHVNWLAHYPAQWTQHDSYDGTCWCADKTSERCNGAGPLRNHAMLREGKPQAVIAFHANLAQSRGTAHMVRIAREARVPVWIPMRQP